MQVAGLRGRVILVLLIGLSGTPPCEKVADLHARWIFAGIIELNRFPLKKFTGNKKKHNSQFEAADLFSHVSLYENQK